MKLESKYFDSIRVSSKRRQSAKVETRAPLCQWKDCDKPGAHKAPKGRGHDGEYFHFCMDHVRHYNQEYDYFDGMSDAEVSSFCKDAMTGHRPTWKTGANELARGTRAVARSVRTYPPVFRRQLKPLERKSLRVLDLSDEASCEDIKARFKELVKIHHPDANGGDGRSEEKLREILQAYNYLKQSSLVQSS